ncbi:DUF523 domain-containing protein [Billgrantia saliphila]|uniref:DUF523 domain-containing protein n=1 Tax=Billgrantia saliphila TaxID=1848458 RepID=UPI000CE3D6AC|nr:DUF523 domain-containing protein [Halomonas saliphila]
MQRVLISACLLGSHVRYDAGALSLPSAILERWLAEGRVVSVCPEVSAGMSIPRPPAEIRLGDGASVLKGQARVIEKAGRDVTSAFRAGAEMALNLCRRHGIRVAVLAEYSPSCGSAHIYDGQFAGTKVPGIGVTTALLRENGIAVFGQHDIEAAQQALLTAEATCDRCDRSDEGEGKGEYTC